MPSVETLPLLLKQLKLPSITQNWQALAEQAEAEVWTYPAYLSALADLEATARHNAKIARLTRASCLPNSKAIDNFDFKVIPSINAAQLKSLCDSSDWVSQAHNVILLGPSGVGKTHLAASIGYSMVAQGIKVLFINASELVQRLQLARTEYRLPQAIEKLARFNLLILDDIAYVKKDDAETSVLFELIADRYETGSIIITANEPFSEWDKIFPSQMMAVAAVDRLIHHATIFNISGDSYRKRQSKKKNK